MAGESLHYVVWIIISRLVLVVNSIQWSSRPTSIQYCEGQNVDFTWNYWENSTILVQMIHWTYLGNGKTMAGWEINRPSTIYPAYKDRVEFLPRAEYNAGLRLLNATSSDSGQYKLELAGPGVVDISHLTVYNDDDLSNYLSINGSAENFASTLTCNINDVTSINVTAEGPTRITLFISRGTERRRVHECHEKRECLYDVMAQYSGNMTVHVETQYRKCPPQIHSFHILVYGSSGPTGGNIVLIAGTCVAAFVVIIGIIIVSVTCKRKHRKKEGRPESPRDLEDMSGRDDNGQRKTSVTTPFMSGRDDNADVETRSYSGNTGSYSSNARSSSSETPAAPPGTPAAPPGINENVIETMPEKQDHSTTCHPLIEVGDSQSTVGKLWSSAKERITNVNKGIKPVIDGVLTFVALPIDEATDAAEETDD